jgi:hypothetical protein
MPADKTAVIEARVDMRDLATCVRWLIDGGVQLHSRSDAVWRIFRSMAETIKTQGDYAYTSTEEALGYMTALQMGSWNRSGRSGRPMGATTLTKTIVAERLETIPDDTIVKDADYWKNLIKSGKVKIPSE